MSATTKVSVDEFEKCETHQQIIDFAKDLEDVEVIERGDFAHIHKKGSRDCASIRRDGKALPKEARRVIFNWFRLLKIITVMGIVFMGSVYAYVQAHPALMTAVNQHMAGR